MRGLCVIETVPSHYNQKMNLTDKFKRFFLTALRLTNQPTVKVYRGYGNDSQLIVYGHVLRRTALPRKNYRDINLVNLLAVVRLFLVKPYPQAPVRVQFGDQVVQTETAADGYFQVVIPLSAPVQPGWHPVRAYLLSSTSTPDELLAEGEGQVLIPKRTQFICVSDIDDTFLISHSATIAKRLLVLLTENAHSRMPFEGVVAHYRLLAEAVTGEETANPFFYVSSSEWNLYDYILEFSTKNGLPDGVYLLSPIKRLRQLLKTGKGKHLTKGERIRHLIDTYPDRRFILLGDDSQQDPVIYAAIVDLFPKQIYCVYMRQIKPEHRTRTEGLMAKMEAHGVLCCYFAHSADARQHSIDIGLIPH